MGEVRVGNAAGGRGGEPLCVHELCVDATGGWGHVGLLGGPLQSLIVGFCSLEVLRRDSKQLPSPQPSGHAWAGQPLLPLQTSPCAQGGGGAASDRISCSRSGTCPRTQFLCPGPNPLKTYWGWGNQHVEHFHGRF